MGSREFELTRSQRSVLKAIRRISTRGERATGPHILSECSSKGGSEGIAKYTMYKAIHALEDAQFVVAKEITIPGRNTPKVYYDLNYGLLSGSGLMDESG